MGSRQLSARALATLAILQAVVLRVGAQLPEYALDAVTVKTKREQLELKERLEDLWCKYGLQRCSSMSGGTAVRGALNMQASSGPQNRDSDVAREASTMALLQAQQEHQQELQQQQQQQAGIDAKLGSLAGDGRHESSQAVVQQESTDISSLVGPSLSTDLLPSIRRSQDTAELVRMLAEATDEKDTRSARQAATSTFEEGEEGEGCVKGEGERLWRSQDTVELVRLLLEDDSGGQQPANTQLSGGGGEPSHAAREDEELPMPRVPWPANRAGALEASSQGMAAGLHADVAAGAYPQQARRILEEQQLRLAAQGAPASSGTEAPNGLTEAPNILTRFASSMGPAAGAAQPGGPALPSWVLAVVGSTATLFLGICLSRHVQQARGSGASRHLGNGNPTGAASLTGMTPLPNSHIELEAGGMGKEEGTQRTARLVEGLLGCGEPPAVGHASSMQQRWHQGQMGSCGCGDQHGSCVAGVASSVAFTSAGRSMPELCKEQGLAELALAAAAPPAMTANDLGPAVAGFISGSRRERAEEAMANGSTGESLNANPGDGGGCAESQQGLHGMQPMLGQPALWHETEGAGTAGDPGSPSLCSPDEGHAPAGADASVRNSDVHQMGWAPKPYLDDPRSSINNPIYASFVGSPPASPCLVPALPTADHASELVSPDCSTVDNPAFSPDKEGCVAVPSAGGSWGSATTIPAASGGSSSGGSSPIRAVHCSQVPACEPPLQEAGEACAYSSLAQQGCRVLSGGMAGAAAPSVHGVLKGQQRLPEQQWGRDGEGAVWAPETECSAAEEGDWGKALLAAESVSAQACQAAVALWEEGGQVAAEPGQEAEHGQLEEMQAIRREQQLQQQMGAVPPACKCDGFMPASSWRSQAAAETAGALAGCIDDQTLNQQQLPSWAQQAGCCTGLAVRLVAHSTAAGEEPRVVWQHTFGDLRLQPGAPLEALPSSPTQNRATVSRDEALQNGGGINEVGCTTVGSAFCHPAPVPTAASLPTSGMAGGATAAVGDNGTPWTAKSAASQGQSPPSLQAGPPPSIGRGAALACGILSLTPQEIEREVVVGPLLGVGGAGCVYQATWRGRQVAIKVLHPSHQVLPNTIAAFKREVQLLARLGRHPHVVTVLSACLEPPHCCIIQELGEGGSLWKLIHEEGLRPQYGTLLQLAEDVASAMHFCHQLVPPVVHRDLKTHNILLGADGRARLCDFGLAKDKNRTFITNDQGTPGTAAYMAPEVFSAGNVNEKADVFAYGVILWECLTGRQPWAECSNIMQIIMAVGVERRRLPIPADCPPQLRKLIKECWREHASLRPCFAEVLQRLREIKGQGDAPVQPQPRRAAAPSNRHGGGAAHSKAKFSPALLGGRAATAPKGGQGPWLVRSSLSLGGKRTKEQSPTMGSCETQSSVAAVHHRTEGWHI